MFIKLFVDARQGMAENIATGSLGNHNYLAGYLAISLPFFLRKKWIWFLL
jgi:hypothetical protein